MLTLATLAERESGTSYASLDRVQQVVSQNPWPKFSAASVQLEKLRKVRNSPRQGRKWPLHRRVVEQNKGNSKAFMKMTMR
ncbi:hypothetical protein E2C01_073190 [Portunus trituberculatus]|uniref:Uncharacterized protein n=1 Tax=Portunus trituberculatus TaxID=210409 RepID=A0A5B7I9X8_PORTR|nr:hypothetical protein [Portunus trituberculatus]